MEREEPPEIRGMCSFGKNFIPLSFIPNSPFLQLPVASPNLPFPFLTFIFD